jgi:hypothetical protein
VAAVAVVVEEVEATEVGCQRHRRPRRWYYPEHPIHY